VHQGDLQALPNQSNVCAMRVPYHSRVPECPVAPERDPFVRLERVCAGARNLLGAKYAVLAMADRPARVRGDGTGIPRMDEPLPPLGVARRLFAYATAVTHPSHVNPRQQLPYGCRTAKPETHKCLIPWRSLRDSNPCTGLERVSQRTGVRGMELSAYLVSDVL
jgi:hypothetical protein